MKLKGAQILLESLLKEKVEVIFGILGGAIMTVYHHMPAYKKIRHILMRHEQGAAHAADGYARASGKVGVCMATSGPGATNLVTGIANAYLDSVPLVAITGQVPTSLIGSDAFQETDIVGITMPITKHNFLVTDVKDLAGIVKKAFYLAKTGRPGPVLIDLPKDVTLDECQFIYPRKVNLPGFNPQFEGHPRQIQKAANLINQSKRPIILAGHGIILSRAEKIFTEFAQKANLPVATTLLGISSFPQNHPLHLGMAGMHGTIQANKASYHADLIFAVGARFDDRITGKLAQYAPLAKVIHLDIDPAELGKNVPVDIPIVGDVKQVLTKLKEKVKFRKRTSWFKQIDKWRKEMSSISKIKPTGKTGRLSAAFVVDLLSKLTKGEANIIADVGQNQMFAARYYRFSRFNTHFSAGGLGPMGYALPAAIGVKVARPKQLVWAIIGDGGFQMTNQELIVLIQEKIDLKILILNNGYLGMVRQWQELFFDKNYTSTKLLNPDFVSLAKSSFIQGERVTKPEEVKEAIKRANQHKGPYLIECLVEPEENVFPMIPAGAPINKMLLRGKNG